MRAPAAIVLLVVVLAGCGGGLSRNELVAKGDAICKRVNAQIAKEPTPKDAAGLKRLADKTVAISDPAIKDMEALQAPDELKQDFAKFVASLKQQRDLTRQIGTAAGQGDTAKIQQIGTSAQKVQAEYRRLSDKIGFKRCGGGN
jgi:outer membrane murein-binding lipoprotein Lpp